MEKAASIIEHDLPKRLAAGDHSTASWLATQTERAALILRSAKRPILAGGVSELALAVPAIRAVLRAVADGGWRPLEAIPLPVEPLSEPLSARKRLRVLAGLLGRVSLPAAILVGLQAYDGLDPSFRIAVQLMTVVFIVVLLLPVIDPHGDRLRLMKEVAQFLRLPSPGWNSNLAPPKEAETETVSKSEPDR
jgi:hypothetical protein